VNHATTPERSGHAGTSGIPQWGHLVVTIEPGLISRPMPGTSATVVPSADRMPAPELRDARRRGGKISQRPEQVPTVGILFRHEHNPLA
jgi:hypothetical protein